MIKHIINSLIILLFITTCFAQDSKKKVITEEDIESSTNISKDIQSDWKVFLFSDLSCNFSLPNAPEGIAPNGKFIKPGVISYSYQFKAKEYSWQVIVSTYQSMDALQFHQEYLNQSKELKGKLINATELDGRPYSYNRDLNQEVVLARQIISRDTNNIYTETRLFFYKNRIMTFTISTADYDNNYLLISKLFSSIHILSGESDNNGAVKLIEGSPGVIRGTAIYKVSPEYPAKAKEKRIEGEVIIEVTIGETGDMIEANIESGNEVFHESVLRAVKQWKFTPTLLDGKPVKVSGKLTFRFKL